MNRTLFVPLSALTVFLALLLAGSTASAQTATDTFDVTITVENSCTITVNNLDFGDVNDLTPIIAASTTGSVTCTAAAPVTVSFNVGSGGGTYVERLMAKGADTIAYNLHSDAAATGANVLGDGSGVTLTIGITSTGGADPFSVFGATVAAQNPKPIGDYSSTVTATATF